LTVFEALNPAVVAGLAQAVARDTVVAIPAQGEWHGWVDTLSGIAQVVIALALIGIGIVTLAILLLSWKVYKKVKAAAEKLRIDVDPAVRNAIAASESARAMVATVQGNVAEISRTVSSANERIGRVVESAETRAADLNALLDVAQQEAEDLFVRTASTLRGVKAGASEFRRTRAVRPASDPVNHEITEDELDIHIEARDAGQPSRIPGPES
jgi:hypothetical protein